MIKRERMFFLLLTYLILFGYNKQLSAAQHQLFSDGFFCKNNYWKYSVNYSTITSGAVETSIISTGKDFNEWNGFDFSIGQVVNCQGGTCTALGNADILFQSTVDFGGSSLVGLSISSYSYSGASNYYLPMADYLSSQSWIPPSNDWWPGTEPFYFGNYGTAWDARGQAQWFKTKEGKYAIVEIDPSSTPSTVVMKWLYPYGKFQHDETEWTQPITGSMILSVKGTEAYKGYSCAVFELQTEILNNGIENIEKEVFYWHKSSYYIQEMKSEKIGDDILEFKNNNPLEVYPIYLDETANNLKVGDGEYKESDNQSEYNIENHITFIGTEDVTTPAGTFFCVKFKLASHYIQSDGEWGSDIYTYWINSDVGIIKVDANESEYDPHTDSISREVYSFTLSETNVKSSCRNVIPAIMKLLLKE